MKKIIFAALLSLTAILVIASCSSEAVKTDYQSTINALINDYVDSAEAVSKGEELAIGKERRLVSNTNCILVKRSDINKIVVKINSDKTAKCLSYFFTSGTSVSPKFASSTDKPEVDLPMENFPVFKGNFEGEVVNALGYIPLQEVEPSIRYLMKNDSSKSALKSSLSAASLKPEAVKKSASVLANLSSNSDLIVKGLKDEKDSKKLAACTSALDLCYEYFSKVAGENDTPTIKYTPTKGDQLAIQLALSYLNTYSNVFVESITDPGTTMSSILLNDKGILGIETALSRAEILDTIADLKIAQYVEAVLVPTN